jgi:hypothetical protein
MAITRLTSLSFTDDSVVAAAIADNAVVTAAINADAVTAAKIGADQIGSSELNLGANYAFTGTVTGAGGGTTPAFHAYRNSSQTIAHATKTVIGFDTETFDTDSCYNTSTYRFTPTTAGWYFIGGFFGTTPVANKTTQAYIVFNGSTDKGRIFFQNAEENNVSAFVCSIIQFNGSTDYVELQGSHDRGSNGTMDGGPTMHYWFGFRVLGI